MLVTRQGFLCKMEVYISSAVGRQERCEGACTQSAGTVVLRAERPEHEIKAEPQGGDGCVADAFMNGSGTELI